MKHTSDRTQIFIALPLLVLLLLLPASGCDKAEGVECGPCHGATEWCNPEGECVDDCLDRNCGPSPNAGLSCGTCTAPGEMCDAQGQCVVDPQALVWVSLPGGSFSMGSDTGDPDEQPAHTVAVTEFEMTMTEVTVAQYGACVGAGSCTDPDMGTNCNWNDPGFENHPVNCVNWQQAVDFCAWADGRLPSEAEWEYAARSGGQDITFPWGNDPATCSYAVVNDGGAGCGTLRTMPTCSKVAGNTDEGLCDMLGNVWEWVQDYHHDSYTGAPTDGSAWDSDGSYRVTRGCCLYNVAVDLRATVRYSYEPVGQAEFLGFRCAR